MVLRDFWTLNLFYQNYVFTPLRRHITHLLFFFKDGQLMLQYWTCGQGRAMHKNVKHLLSLLNLWNYCHHLMSLANSPVCCCCSSNGSTACSPTTSFVATPYRSLWLFKGGWRATDTDYLSISDKPFPLSIQSWELGGWGSHKGSD